MSKAQDILFKAKVEIISHIRYEINQIHSLVHKDYDDELPYTSEEDWPCSPAIRVVVDNSYLDVEETTYETRKVVTLSIEDDENITAEDENGNEHKLKNLTIEELAFIADTLETSYFKLIKNN